MLTNAVHGYADSSQWSGMVTPRKGEWYTVKKGLQFSRPRNFKLSLEGNNLIIPAFFYSVVGRGQLDISAYAGRVYEYPHH